MSDAEPPEPHKPDRKPGKDTLLLMEKDRQIAALTERAKDAEAGEDKAQGETIESWKWTATAWRNAFVGSWAIAAILAAFVLGVNYLDLNVPYIGHLKLSRDATSAGEKAAEEHNVTEEVLDEEPPG